MYEYRKLNREQQKKFKVGCSYSDGAIRDEQHYYQVLNYIHD